MSKMEITIANAILKNAINRVFALVDKKASIPAFQGVLIKAAENKVAISAANFFDKGVYATVYIEDVTVFEDGAVVIPLVEMEKILMIKGMINVSTDGNYIVSAKSDKKKSKVCGISDGEFPDIPTVENSKENLVMDIPDGVEFCKDMKILGATKGDNPSRPLYTGFNFDSQKKAICTIDGYQMTVKKIDSWSENNTNIVVSGSTDGDLTKLVGKDHGNISMYKNQRFVSFVGRDFEYISRMIDGNFIDWESLIPNKNDALSEFSFADTKGFLDTLKEYDKFNNAKSTSPFIMASYSDGSILTDYRNTSYITTDEVEISGKVDSDLFMGFSPKFFYTALNLYHKLGVDYTVRIYSRLKPIIITGGDFLSLVVPMRVSETRNRESIVKDYAA